MKYRRTLLITLLPIFMNFGCQNNLDRSMEINDKKDNNQIMNVRNSNVDQIPRRDSEKVSRHLANLAAGVPDVENATAVAIGNYAIVGIDVDENLDRSKVGTIKYSVAEAMKDDPHGARAIIVADPDITARLKEVREDIQDGKPIRGILNELADIVGRVMPEIPGQIQDPDPQSVPKNQQNDINQRDKDRLQQQQDKQSKAR